MTEKSSDNVFFFCSFFLVIRGSNGFFQRKLVPEGVLYFAGEGVQLFPGGGGGGGGGLFPIETNIACDFPGGSPDPLSFPPPLDPRMQHIFIFIYFSY